MIRKLTGMVEEITQEGVVLDVGGVGYDIHCSASVREGLPPCGQKLTMWIETHMREHAITLYGFATASQREWFSLLVSVHGVGHKMALGILGALSLDALNQAIALEDKAALSECPGVGKRLAERLIHELSDKLPPMPAEIIKMDKRDDGLANVVSALVNLGYGERQARSAAAKIITTRQTQPLAETFLACLQELPP